MIVSLEVPHIDPVTEEESEYQLEFKVQGITAESFRMDKHYIFLAEDWGNLVSKVEERVGTTDCGGDEDREELTLVDCEASDTDALWAAQEFRNFWCDKGYTCSEIEKKEGE